MKIRNYIGCKGAADAMDKVTLDGKYVFYFNHTDVRRWLDKLVEGGGDHHYDWKQREIVAVADGWYETKRKWIDIMEGDFKTIRERCNGLPF